MRALPALFVLFSLSFGSAATAKKQEPYRPSAPTIVASPLALALAAFDRDGDLKVSRTEADWGVSRSFSAFDRNEDAALTLLELNAWSEAVLGNTGALPGSFDFDRDGDDKISQAEFSTLFANRFVDLDKNKDAALTRSELVTFVDAPLQRRRRGEPNVPPPR
jgi:hypothetical protein